MENKEKIRVSDVIPQEEIRKWENGDVVLISAPCGAGKSYFIKNVLYEYAKGIGKKILMLIHRSACVNQFSIEIENAGKSDIIDIRTYQSIEFALTNGNYGVFSKDYAFVVSDEFHYFVEDSGFNCFTDLSFNAIVKYPNAVKIFMSATGDVMEHMMEKSVYRKSKMYHYSAQADFSHIASLNYFFQSETMRTLAYRLKKANKKAIFFCQSIEEAHSLYNEFRDCSIFLCGKNSANGKKYYADVNEEKIKEMLEKQRFEEQFLFCTSCFDAGANIVDPELHIIVADMTNISSLIQCVGRKRSQGADDKIHLFIKGISNKQIGGLISKDDFKHRYEIAEILNVLEKHDIRNLIQNNAVAQLNFIDFLRKKYHLVYDTKEQSMRYPAEKELLEKYCREYGDISQQRFSAMLMKHTRK